MAKDKNQNRILVSKSTAVLFSGVSREVCVLAIACAHLHISFQFLSVLKHQEEFSDKMLPFSEDT